MDSTVHERPAYWRQAMGASSVITIVVSAGSAVLLVYWIVCLAILARKDGAERLHRR